jgi:hypothetical protein
MVANSMNWGSEISQLATISGFSLSSAYSVASVVETGREKARRDAREGGGTGDNEGNGDLTWGWLSILGADFLPQMAPMFADVEISSHSSAPTCEICGENTGHEKSRRDAKKAIEQEGTEEAEGKCLLSV